MKLEDSGLRAFKCTVNGNYFQWLPTTLRVAQFRAVLGHWLGIFDRRHPIQTSLLEALYDLRAELASTSSPAQARRERPPRHPLA